MKHLHTVPVLILNGMCARQVDCGVSVLLLCEECCQKIGKIAIRKNQIIQVGTITFVFTIKAPT